MLNFNILISGDNIEEINKYAPIIMNKLTKYKEIQDINSDQRDRGLQVYVKVDYNKAASLGITNKQVDIAFIELLVKAYYQQYIHYKSILCSNRNCS
ncbi:MAG: efflux RND transporter permease subunit [Candidatus Rickettsia vulgarisii]